MGTVYYEGAFIPEAEALLPISDRGFQHGDGAYATIQVREGVPLFFEPHHEQLQNQCRSFNLEMPDFELSIIEELIQRNRAFEGIWRLKIFITGGDSPENRLPERRGRLLIVLKPFSPLPFKPLKMGIFPIPYWSCHASFKSLAHLNRFYVMEEAYRQGMDDCVTHTETGHILEAAFGNLVWVREKTVFTPDPTLPIYFGVTVRNILEIARGLGFHIEYVKIKLSMLPREAVAFRTNTMQGVRPISQIGDHLFAHSPTIETLLVKGYEELIKNQVQSAAAPAAFKQTNA